MNFCQNVGLLKIYLIWYWLYLNRKNIQLTNLFSMAHAIYMISIEPVVCFSLLLYYCYYFKRGVYWSDFLLFYGLIPLFSTHRASYISTKHMHLDAMKKWYKLSKSLAIWFPCLQSIIMESLDIQKWEIKRLIKKDFSHGTLSHMSEFFPSFFFSTSFIHRETHFRQVFTTAWHHGTKGFMTFIAIQKKGRTNEIIFWFLH